MSVRHGITSARTAVIIRFQH